VFFVVKQNMENIIFQEQQRFSLWLRWLIYLSMGFSAGITVFAMYKIPATEGSHDSWEITLGWVVGIGVPIAIAALFLFLKLETYVSRDGIDVRFFPFHIRFKRFRPEDLSEYYARRYRPIWEYGGWGIRYSFRYGKAYNVSGNRGVQLVFKNGKKLLIGTQKPEQLEAAIREIM
jgi:hypothetical protein